MKFPNFAHSSDESQIPLCVSGLPASSCFQSAMSMSSGSKNLVLEKILDAAFVRGPQFAPKDFAERLVVDRAVVEARAGRIDQMHLHRRRKLVAVRIDEIAVGIVVRWCAKGAH